MAPGRSSSLRVGVAVLSALPWLVPGAAWAQQARAKLTVTAVDPSGAVLPGATVTVTGLEPETKAAAAAPASTNDKGSISFESLVPGRYSIQAEFPGFEPGLLRDVRLRAGDNKHAIVLPLKGMTDSVTVSAGAREISSSRAGAAFGLTLSRAELDALADDPDELSRQLTDLGGVNTVLRIDSFEGATLPPKAQIKSIHVTRDQFAAETAQPGSTFVDVITQPGVGAIRGAAGVSFQDGSWIARNPFASARGPQQNRGFNGNVGGTLVKNTADFSASINHNHRYTKPYLYANVPGGLRSEVLNLRQTSYNTSGSGILNYAVTRDQTLRVSYSQGTSGGDNQGIGLYDLPERAFSRSSSFGNLRVQEAGPIGRRSFLNTRLTVLWQHDRASSSTDERTIVVQDEFTRGGAQTRGGTRQLGYTLASDLDHVRGIHSWRTGVEITGSRYRTDAQTNYLGTYTFSDIDSYLLDRPILFTRETGDPAFAYSNVQGAGYVQDDLRISKALTLSPGVRYSLQTHIEQRSAYEPRFGVTWSPFKKGRTTLRASTGLFHNFVSTSTYEQTIRFDGTHQRQVIIANPPFPDPGSEGSATPGNSFLLGRNYQLITNVRHSAGIDQAVTPKLRVSFIYAYIHATDLPRGRNLNAPIDGVRPDPTKGNVVESITDGQLRRHDYNATLNWNLAPAGAATEKARFDWRRLAINAQFFSTRGQRNVGFTAFSVPASGTLDTEWGPAPASTPWGINVLVNSTQLKNLSVQTGLFARSGFVYTETTGFDDNHDGLLNDRRPGVGLNSLRTPGFSTLNARVAYTFQRGTPARPANQPASAAGARSRVQLYANANNVTNRANYSGFSGVLTSSNYRRPTGVNNPRSVSIGVNVNF